MPPSIGSPSSSKTSSTPVVSTLRPRTRRLISVDDELDASSAGEPSPFGSRTASLIPSSHPSRANISNPTSSTRSSSGPISSAGRNQSSTATFSGLWDNSWSAIQGLASNVLGSDTVLKDTQTRRRKPLAATHRRTSTSAPPKQWGPLASSVRIGAGSQEERESMVRAMKRKDLLNADNHLHSDAVGRLKRRNSDERISVSAPPAENDDRDALIYIHHVRPQDTLAGISIKYNCQQAMLRKANRMWPNDSIQIKKTIVIPVDACGVKGRPVPGPDEQNHQEDLLLGEYDDDASGAGTPASKTNSIPNGWKSLRDQEMSTPPIASSQTTSDSDVPWKPDSWVILPNDKEPTQIGRMPRRSLGFFPPARRKSLTFSDSTPKSSLDLPRSSTSTTYTNSKANSPSQPNASFRSQPAHQRGRSISGSFSLLGPGGVGTLGRNVRSPGPAQDSLNKLFASHLPSVAPPPGQEYFTPWAPSLLDAEEGATNIQLGGSGARTPMGGTGLELENIGGAVEGWMRKMGSRVSTMLSEPPPGSGQGKHSAVPMLGAVGGDLGDLIELEDSTFSIGDGVNDDSERGRSTINPLEQTSSGQYQSPRTDSSIAIRERGRKGAGAKTD